MYLNHDASGAATPCATTRFDLWITPVLWRRRLWTASLHHQDNIDAGVSMDELASDGVQQHEGDVEMERRRAEMHRRIMAARRAGRPATSTEQQPDPAPSSA